MYYDGDGRGGAMPTLEGHDASHALLTSLGFTGLTYEKTVVSAVTTSWGVSWDEDLIARDVMQNYFDANRACVERIAVQVDGNRVTVSAPAHFDVERLYYLGS